MAGTSAWNRRSGTAPPSLSRCRCGSVPNRARAFPTAGTDSAPLTRWSAAQEPRTRRVNMRVRGVMNTDVATATPGTPISEVAKLMADKDVGSVVILEGNRPVGIVTDRDLVLDHLALGHTADHPVREAVSTGNALTGLVTVPPDMDLLEAAHELGRRKVGRLPVVQGEQLVGILSAGDLSKQLKQALDGLLAEGEKAER